MIRPKIFIVLFVFIFFGCSLIQNNIHTEFTYYKNYPCDSNFCNQIKKNGVYKLQNNPKKLIWQYYFFYEDGEVLYGDSFWGHYKIRNDSLFIQYFFLDGATGFYYRNIIEAIGKVKNDSIFIYEERCDWYNKRYGGDEYPNGKKTYDPPRLYTFEKTDAKPDSTNAFYFDKKWYREGLSERKARIN